MPLVSQLSESKYNFILCVGDSGAGKTCAMASWPGKTEVHDWDGRIRGLNGHPGYSDKKLSDISVVQYGQGSGFALAEKNFDLRKMHLDSNTCPYQNMLLDSMSSLGDEMLSDGMKYTSGEMKQGSLKLPQIQDYKYESEAIRQLILAKTKFFKCNIFLTAHIIPKYGKPPGAKPGAIVENIIIGEKILGRDKISAKIPTFFDNVWEFRKDASFSPAHYICHFRNTPLSRTTFRNLPDKIDWTWVSGKQEKLFYDLISEFLPREGKENENI